MHLSIVLVAPARAENIGAAARAMKTMGFTDLRIVDSQAHLEPAARWVAHGSGDILDNITTYDTLAAALHDISFTVATTARSRAKFHYYATPAELVPMLTEKSQWLTKAALVFGFRSDERGAGVGGRPDRCADGGGLSVAEFRPGGNGVLLSISLPNTNSSTPG